MCKHSPCQLSTLTSEIFSERMISTLNLRIKTHRISLDYNDVDKIIVLRMNKKFMERVQRKEAFTSILFQDILSVDECFILVIS